MSFGVCTGLLEIHEKPPMAGECILSKDGTALFFFSCVEWDLTAMLNVLARFYCASISTYWQAQLMRENKPLIWCEWWALCHKKDFQPTFRIQKISLLYLQEALIPFFFLNKILSKLMLSVLFSMQYSPLCSLILNVYIKIVDFKKSFQLAETDCSSGGNITRQKLFIFISSLFSWIRRQTGGILGIV